MRRDQTPEMFTLGYFNWCKAMRTTRNKGLYTGVPFSYREGQIYMLATGPICSAHVFGVPILKLVTMDIVVLVKEYIKQVFRNCFVYPVSNDSLSSNRFTGPKVTTNIKIKSITTVGQE